MALWNKVVSGFDREEETVNFGARTIAEKDGSLYETSTIATIQSDGKVTKEPNVLASVQYSRICVAIDKSITIFEDEMCEKILLSVSFGLLISCYCISNDGAFLFVVLSNGTLYCLHLLNKGQVIFSRNIIEGANKLITIFLQHKPDGYIDIYLVTNSGTIYIVSQLNLKLIQATLINEVDPKEVLKKLAEQIECKQLFRGLSYDEVLYAAVGLINKEVYVAMLLPNTLFMWPCEQYNNFNTTECNYIKAKFFNDHIAMLCLRADYKLCLVCSQTLLGVTVYDKPVSDFAIIQNNDHNSCEIIVLLKSSNNYSADTLHVFSFPDFQEKFQIKIPNVTYLVEIKDPSDEMILYLEGFGDDKLNGVYADTIRIKTITESIPELQLQRLIRREQFEAAEIFAQKFHLSAEPIYCSKAALILSQFGLWSKKDSNQVQLDELLAIFDRIEDIQYVVECCSKALIPSFKQMRKIQLYARSRIIANSTKDNKHLDLLSIINNVLHKLETFHMIWGYKKNVEYYDEETMKECIRFSRTDFMEEYKTHLKLGEIEAATLIWARHFPDLIRNISMEIVRDIFAIIPNGTAPLTLWPWLSHFIPTLLSFFPSAMNDVILWCCKKVKSFEQSHRSDWPQIGIDFIKKFIKLLKFDESHETHFSQEFLNKDSNLKQLVALIQSMTDILKLKNNYRLTIPLECYIGNAMDVSHMLLDKIHVDLIPQFVNTFLKQYMLNNSLQNDSVFSLYIQKTMKNSKSWWSGEEAPWEKKVVVIISLIHNIETKLLQTLEVLKKASVPWSSTIVSLVENSSNYDHVLTSQIRIEYNCVPIKLILKKYGYEHIGINNNLIHRIIKKNYESMILDIQQITKNDLFLRKKAFSLCINHYLRRGNFETVMKVLESLENDNNILLYCYVQIVNYITASLTLKNVPESTVHYIEMLGSVKLHLEILSKKCKAQSHHCYSIIKDINDIRSVYILKKEYQINVSIQEYRSDKQLVLQNYIRKINEEVKEDIDKDGKLYEIFKKVRRVADLLKYQRVGAISLLLEHFKNLDLLNYFFRSEDGQLCLTTDECIYVREICLLILQHSKMNADIACTIQNLSSVALCSCLDDDLDSMVLLHIWTNLYQECTNTNFRSELNPDEIKHEEIRRANWKLYTIYKDLAVAADEFLLPLFWNVTSVHKFYVTMQPLDRKCVDTNKPIQCDDLISAEKPLRELLDKIKQLQVEHKDYCFMQIVKTLYFTFCGIPHISFTLLMEIRSVYFHLLTVLLKKVINTRTFDLHLSLSCLFMLSNSEACKWISTAFKSFQPDCARHLRITTLGYEFHHLTKNQSALQLFKNNKILHNWAQKLSKYSISYKEILTSDATSKRDILQRVMNSNDDMIPLLKEFCYDFGFDIQDCLLLYLQTVVKTWNPTLNINNHSSKKELQINEDEISELRKKCNDIAAQISDKNALKNCVTAVFSQINFYHYETFIILMDLIEEKSIERRSYFCFLQNYTRTGQPTQIEYDEWMHLYPGYTSLPAIAEWRLPYLPKVELWTLITPELNLKTYKQWLDIAPTLKLQPHIICTLAIKGEVTRAWATKLKSGEWSLHPKNNSLLNDIKKCIEHMTGPQALYYGSAALYYVVNHTPPGADQVAAVEECYKYAQLSAKTTSFEEGMLEKIKFKYLRSTSEHILHTHGLHNKHYLALIGNPQKLVRELYMDESIPKRYRCVIDHRPDINSAVNSISQLFSINVIKLRMELLQEWLQPDTKYVKFNQSVTDTFTLAVDSETNLNSDDALLRACYILDQGDLELSANFLINMSFGEKNEDYSSEARYRALHVLQTIVGITKLEDLTKRDYHTIRNYMRSLKYIGKLELLGIGYSINTFETCSKEELVQILWKTQSYSTYALVIIAHLCVDFKIYEYSIWDKNLTKLAKLFMINELRSILPQVRNVGAIVNSTGYLLGWEVVISEPFKKMDNDPTAEQIDKCIEALQLLYSCPVVHMLHFNDILKCCFQCQQPHLAIALLPFLNDDDTKFTLDKIKHISNTTKILENLNNLFLNGILCVNYCNKIVKEYMN